MNQEKYLNIHIPDSIDGHKRIRMQWETGNSEAELEIQRKMKEMFIELKKNGYRIYKVKKRFGFVKTKGPEIESYDPNLGEFIYEKDRIEFEKGSVHQQEMDLEELKRKSIENSKKNLEKRKNNSYEEVKMNIENPKEDLKLEKSETQQKKEELNKKKQEKAEKEKLEKMKKQSIEKSQAKLKKDREKQMKEKKETKGYSIREYEENSRDVKYEERKKIDPEKDEIDIKADYVAAVPMYRG